MLQVKRLLLTLVFALPLMACDTQGPAEETGERIDDAADDTRDRLDDAGDRMQDTVD